MVLQMCHSATGPHGSLPIASLRPSARGPAEQNGYNSSLLPHSLRDRAARSHLPTSPVRSQSSERVVGRVVGSGVIWVQSYSEASCYVTPGKFIAYPPGLGVLICQMAILQRHGCQPSCGLPGGPLRQLSWLLSDAPPEEQ